MRFPRIYTDEQGETTSVSVTCRSMRPRSAAAKPRGAMTDREAVSSFVTFSAPAGTKMPSHNAPQPYIWIVLSGEGEVEASDGTTARLGPGGLIYCDDVSGKGHITRSIIDLHVAFINRASA